VFAIFELNHVGSGLSAAWRPAVGEGGVMSSRLLKLPDWRMAAAWVAAVALGVVIYFLPIARLLDSLTETRNPLVSEEPRGR
jgi:hypothetical protein